MTSEVNTPDSPEHCDMRFSEWWSRQSDAQSKLAMYKYVRCQLDDIRSIYREGYLQALVENKIVTLVPIERKTP